MMCVVITRQRTYGWNSRRSCTFLRLSGDAVVTGHVDVVRAWRTSDHERLLWMQGVTTSYRVDPVGEYVIGVTSGPGYRLQRGRLTTIVRPGQLVVLDPSAPHSGTSVNGAPWAGRLLVIELPDLCAEVFDADTGVFDLVFPDVVIDNPHAAGRFSALHHDMTRPASTLERQSAAHIVPRRSRRTFPRRGSSADPNRST